MPARLRGKLDQKWRYGVFLGRSLSSDQNFVGIAGGNVVRARAILRLVPSARWDSARLLGVTTTPLTENSRFMDDIETKDAPHEHPPVDIHGPIDAPARRRVRITLADLKKFGFSDHCPRCSLHRQEEHRSVEITVALHYQHVVAQHDSAPTTAHA